MDAQAAALFIYNLALVPVVFFSALLLILSLISLALGQPRKKRWPRLDHVPFVSVQVPTYNDPIAMRCVEKCLAFDYPRDRFEILIVDDSTNVHTQELLRGIAKKHAAQVHYIHRDNREGFKPGALKNAMAQTRGEILVIFDADWLPQRDFLRRVIRPFGDEKVAIVQTRQGIYNAKTNYITRFATYLLTVYHHVIMPINNTVNCVFFGGTAGAIRRSAFEEAGGWNLDSLTEDADLSVRLLLRGYKSVYLTDETPSEVPDTYEGFIRQQMRWCYGNARVFFDNAPAILFGRNLSLRQRAMILFTTLSNGLAPIIIVMTFFGLAGWFLGSPQLLTATDVVTFLAKFSVTAGFLVIGIFALARSRRMRETPQFLFTAFTLGIMLSVATSFAFIRAALNRKLTWFCTPKANNSKFA